MSKENVINLVQSLLVLVGGFLVGDNLLGNAIDNTLWMGVVGVLLTLIGFVWDIATTKLAIEYVQTTIMGIIQFVGGLLVASGKLSLDNANSYYGLVTSLITVLYPLLSRKKSTEIANGDIPVAQLKGANDKV